MAIAANFPLPTTQKQLWGQLRLQTEKPSAIAATAAAHLFCWPTFGHFSRQYSSVQSSSLLLLLFLLLLDHYSGP